MKTQKYEKTNDSKILQPSKVSIIGFGPGGMFAMFYALRQGSLVDIYENRNSFDRVNGIYLEAENQFEFQWLAKLFVKWNQKQKDDVQRQANTDILLEIQRSRPIPIGLFQRWVLKTIPMLKEQFPNQLKLHGNFENADDDLKISSYSTDGTIYLNDGSSIIANHLLLAEGSKRHVAKELGFCFERSFRQLQNPYFVKGKIKQHLISLTPKSVDKTSHQTRYDTKDYAYASSGDQFTLQIPLWIALIANKNDRLEEIKRFTCAYFEEERGIAVSERCFVFFEDNVFEATFSAVVGSESKTLLNGTVVTLIGDARQTSYFATNYGANAAMRGAKIWATLKDTRVFQIANQQLKTEIERKIQETLPFKYLLLYPVNEADRPNINTLLNQCTRSELNVHYQNNQQVMITTEDPDFKKNSAFFIRFMLNKHALDPKKNFQDLFYIENLTSRLIFHGLTKVLVIIMLDYNKTHGRPLDTPLDEASFNSVITHYYDEFQAQQACNSTPLYLEMSVSDLVSYLKNTNQLDLISALDNDGSIELNLMGLHHIQTPYDYCSLYDILSARHEDSCFVDELYRTIQREKKRCRTPVSAGLNPSEPRLTEYSSLTLFGSSANAQPSTPEPSSDDNTYGKRHT